jgi:hypothetical protein
MKNLRNLDSLDDALPVSVTHWFLAGSHVLQRIFLVVINPVAPAFRGDPSMTAKSEPQPGGLPPLLFA